MNKQIITQLIIKKQTNVIFSADLTDKTEILNLVDIIGPKILGVKLHTDIITDFDQNFVSDIKLLSTKHEFLIIDDRKFCDIGNTVKLQSNYITTYADLITCHAISGPGIIEGLLENCIKNKCGILLIAQMSSENNLIDNNYTNQVIKLAKQYNNVVTGFICQNKLDDNFLHLTPGVNLVSNHDNLGQVYNSPEYLINEKGVDILIVGRGLYQYKGNNLLEETDKYIKINHENLSKI